MSNEPTENRVAEAIRAVLRLLPNATVASSLEGIAGYPHSLAVVSYSSSFDVLWRLDPGVVDWLWQGGVAIVVWDASPKDTGATRDIRIGDYVTAFDWAVAFALEASAQQSRTTNRPCSGHLYIVDLASQGHPSSHAVTALPKLQRNEMPAVPWLRIVGASALETLLVDLLGEEDRAGDVDVALLKPLWRHSLADPAAPDDRHAISNLIGPRLLLESLASATKPAHSAHLAALQKLMRSVDLIQTGNLGRLKGAVIDRSEWSPLFSRVVLIDDMAPLGWEDFLRRSFGAAEAELITCSSPDVDNMFGANQDQTLLEFLQAVLVGRSVRLENTALCGSERPLVFLDLRLFSQRANTRAEIQFQTGLIAIARDCASRRDSFLWPVIDAKQIDLMEGNLAVERPRDGRYHLALTLLPRLLSLAAPMVPIIIFSSASHRRVVDGLREHGNLVVDFAKPTFFGGPSAHIVEESIRTLRQAVSRAISFGKARSVVDSVAQAATVDSVAQAATVDSVAQAAHSTRPAVAAEQLVEIYFEESGRALGPGLSSLKLGGLVVTYPTLESARAFSGKLRGEGFNWGEDCDDPFEPAPTQFLRKAYFPGGQTADGIVRDGLKRINKLAEADGMSICAFEISADSVRETGLLSWSAPDAVYRLLLSQSLEILLFDWVPTRKLEQKPINIYVGTRMVAATGEQLVEYQRRFGLNLRLTKDKSEGTAYEMDAANLQSSWSPDSFAVGFSRGQGASVPLTNNPALSSHSASAVPLGLLAYGFASDDVYPLVTELFRRRRATLAVNKALGVTLAYHGGRKRPTDQMYGLPRQLHYATDWVISKRHCVPGDWWDAGFRVQSDDRLQSLLRCSRALDDSDRIVEALRHWSVLNEQKAAGLSADRYLLSRAQARTQKMTGEQLLRLGRVLVQS